MQLETNELEKQNELSLNPSEDESDRRCDVIGDSVKKAINTVESAAKSLASKLNDGSAEASKTTTASNIKERY